MNNNEMNQYGNNSVQISEITGGNITFNFIRTENEVDAIPFMSIENSATIIGLCKSINVYLIKVGTVLLKNPAIYDDCHLVSNDFFGWLSKLKDFMGSFDLDGIRQKYSLSAKYPLAVLAEYLFVLSPDISMKLNSFYHTRILYTIDCVYKYNEKSNEFFLALGMLGLAKDYSDKRIYECVVCDLQMFFTMVRDILDAYTKEIDYAETENKATSSMNDHIYDNIRLYFNKESIPALKMLFVRGKMIDVDLANEIGMDVTNLRKVLFPATKKLLNYGYQTPNSTMVWISEPYLSVIRKYYDKLFVSEESI